MRITGFSIQPVELKYPAPVRISHTIFVKRKILYIYLYSVEKWGVGEVSPLTEFGAEDIIFAEKAANEICTLLLERSKQTCLNTEDLSSLVEKYKLFPATLSGIEQAFVQLYTKCVTASVKELYGFSHIEELEVNAMIGAEEPEKAFAMCKEAWNNGYNTIKLKVGKHNLYNELHLLSLIREHMPEKVKIRLDANGAFDVTEAVLRIRAYSVYKIEYIEQPVKTIAEFEKIREHVDIPLALDESISGIPFLEQEIGSNTIDFFIIKPAQLGMLRQIIPVIRSIESEGKGVVITHSLESRIGRRKAVVCALSCLFRSSHGLGIVTTKNGIPDDSYPVINGKIGIKEAIL